jgi:putative membrane protein
MAHKIDHARINAAIARAEALTSGEITCMIKSKALDYPETPLMWGIGVSLIIPFGLMALGIWPHDWLAPLLANLAGWNAPGVTGEMMVYEAILFYALTQITLFIITYLIVSLPSLRVALTPKSIKIKRAHQKALEQFKARGLHLTADRTGVMIFCAVEEHFVEVIADEGIYTKVDKTVWRECVAVLLKHIKSGDMTTGFEAAIDASAKVLAQHFPPGSQNPNELPDVLIEI